MRDSVVFYRSFYEAIRELPDEDLVKCFKAIMDYGLDEVVPEEAGIAKSIYLMAKPQIDANNKRYLNGTKGGRPKNKPEPNQNQTRTKPKPNETTPEPKEKEKDKEKVKEKDNNKTICPEAEKSALDSKTVIAFVLNDGTMYDVSENDVEYYQQLYPGIDVMQELRKIAGWCDANQKNRKTRSGAKRFLNNWLTRAQDKAPVQRNRGGMRENDLGGKTGRTTLSEELRRRAESSTGDFEGF